MATARPAIGQHLATKEPWSAAYAGVFVTAAGRDTNAHFLGAAGTRVRDTQVLVHGWGAAALTAVEKASLSDAGRSGD